MSGSTWSILIAAATVGLLLAALLARRSEAIAYARFTGLRARATDDATPVPQPPTPISPVLAGLALIGVGAFIFYTNHVDRSLQPPKAPEFDGCKFKIEAPLEVAAGDTFTVDLTKDGTGCPALKEADLYLNGSSQVVTGLLGNELTFGGNLTGRRWEISKASAGVQTLDVVIPAAEKKKTYLVSLNVNVKQLATLTSVGALLTNGSSLLAALSGILIALIGFLRGKPVPTH